MSKRLVVLSLSSALFVFLACSLPGLGASPTEIPFDPRASAADQDGAPTGPSTAADTPFPAGTPEPTLEPTPLNTPGPAPGELLYETDFSGLSGWQSFPWWPADIKSIAGSDFKVQLAAYVAEVRRGAYYFEVPKKHTSISAFYHVDLDARNVAITANTVLTLDRPWTYISLACRYQPTEGWYDFSIQSDGHWFIRKVAYLDGTLFQVIILDSGSSGAINYGAHGAANRLSASCAGSTLTFYVNGTLLGSAEDSAFQEGWVGVGVAAGDAGNSLAEFEDLTVTVP